MRFRVGTAIATALIVAGGAASSMAAVVGDPKPLWVPDGEVKAVAISGSTAYIGGNFGRIGPYTGSSARFDAATAELKQPWPEVNGTVNDIVSDGAGGWYLAGNFFSVGSVPRTDLAHVLADGTLDPGWAPSTNGEVRALAVGGGTVFAGGEFSEANGAPRGNLAGFSTTTGALTGFTGSVSGAGAATMFDPLGIHALLLIGSTLYGTGEFNLASGTVRLRGAAWSTADSTLQAWNPSTNRLINGIGRDSDGADIFIGGRFNKVNVNPADMANTGQMRNAVAKVNESAGTVDANWVTPLQASDLTTLTVSGTWVYIGGSVQVAPGQTWPVAAYNTVNNNAGLNGNWHPVPPGSVRAITVSGSTAYLGSGSASSDGFVSSVMGVDATNFPDTGTPSFAPKLGRGREQLPSGATIGVRAIGVSGSDVIAGGTFMNAGGVERRNLAQIDISTGQPTAFNPPMKGMFSQLSSVSALALTTDGLVWAGGDFITEGPNERTSLAAFDAASGALASFRRDPAPFGISALLASGTNVYVGGSFTALGGVARRNLALVTNVPGEQGTVLPFDPDVDGAVDALALAGDTLYLGGSFASVNSGLAALKRDRRNLAAVDAATGIARDWDPDADNVVRTLAIDGNTVFAGGDFATVNRSAARQRLAAFDAVTGTATGWAPSADGPVRALALYGPTVFAGGDFANAGGAARTGVAAFDAQSAAVDPFALELVPEPRTGPSPPVTRVGALGASADAGLLVGGTFVMNSPTPRAANLAAFALPPLPVPPPAGGTPAPDGGTPSGGPPGGTTNADTIAPILTLATSARTFRVARGTMPLTGKATAAAKKKRPPKGTTLRLRLTEAASVRFEVLAKSKGRKVGKRCVKPTRKNRKRKACTRFTRGGVFTRSAPAGRSTVKWSGRIRRKALKRGRYELRATPTDAARNKGKTRKLAITIK